QEDLALVRLPDFKGPFADDAEAHVFKERHAPAQRYRGAEMIDLERRVAVLLLRMAMEIDGDRIMGGQTGNPPGVEQRSPWFETVAVALGEAGSHGSNGRFHACVFHGFPESIVPRPHDCADGGFQLLGLYARRLAARSPDDEVHACKRALGKGRVIGRDVAVEDRLEVVPDPLAYIRVIAIPGNEDDDGNEAVELVDAIE